MARYKGKREAPRPVQADTQPEAQTPVGDPFADDTRLFQAGGGFEDRDFSPEPPQSAGPKGDKPPVGERLGRFFRSRKGKITVIAVACVLAFVVGGSIAVSSWLSGWIKAPELPQTSDKLPPAQQQEPDTETPAEPAEPTDDELYPDDGYDGDMPTVSGDRKEGVYTFLLVGTDKGDGNTDTIMVATYDTANQDVNIMSIPRDTMINEKWDIKKINSVYSRTGNSIESLAKRVKKLVGFEPDFYVKVDLRMFVELVDLVGGVEFDVPQDMNYDDQWQDLHIHLKKGVQVLDGEKAMELVRFRRYPEGDIKRVEVQQNFMKALIKECLSIEHWGKIKAYIDLAMENVQTNLDFGSVVWFAANVLGLKGTPALKMEDVYTCTIPGNYYASAWSRATGQEQSYVTIYPNQVVTLVNERFNPYQQKVTTAMLDAMSILDNGDIASSTGSVKDQQHNAVMAVRRGEAYYDENGAIVYGKPPVKPEVDENGNYFIIDENGVVIYTDEKGTPLDQLDPVLPPDTGADSGADAGADSGTETSGEPGSDLSGETSGEREEPVTPPEGEPGGETPAEPDDGIDTKPPDWL